MNKTKKILVVLLTILLTTLVACNNSSDNANAKSDNPSSNDTTSTSDTTPADNSLDSNNEDDEDTSVQVSTKENDVEVSNSDIVSKKDEYIVKLNELEKELDGIVIDGTTLDMEETQAEIYHRWDDALNEVYGVLEEQLPANEMEKLREEQRNWITYRDEVAAKNAAKYEGGTMYPLEYVATQAEVTKERCFELVEKYMK